MVVPDKSRIPSTPRVGMKSSHLDDAGHQQRQGHFALGVTLASSEIISLGKLFQGLIRAHLFS